MTDKDVVPVPVEIIEPVVVKENGERKHREGARWVTIGYVLGSLGVFLGLYFGFSNDQRLQREIAVRCQVSEQSRSVLREEHTAKLVLAQDDLTQALKFQRGERKLPAGFDQSDITRAVAHARANIKIEKRLLSKVQPVPCK